MRDLYLLPDCRRAVWLHLADADKGDDEGLGLRLARAVDRACAELTTDPATSGPGVVLGHLLAQGPVDEKGLASAERISAAWSCHWAVRGVASSSWRKAEELKFVSSDGRMTVRAQLRVIRQSDDFEHVILYRVGRVPDEEREQTAAMAQLAVVRQAAPTVAARQVYLAGLQDQRDLSAQADMVTAAYERLIVDATAREAACDRDKPPPAAVSIPGCKRCRMAFACGGRP
jgi:hypothetical protein